MGINNTIVSACDSKYVWGGFLLVASLQRFSVKNQFKLISHGLNSEEKLLFSQFKDVEVRETVYASSRSVCTQKPEALLAADTEYVTWMDADCMVEGDISEFLHQQDKKMQIRFRDSKENAGVYRKRYSSGDVYGTIPLKIKKIWQKDVNDLDTCNIETNILTNCFTLHRSQFEFINLWQEQMLRVIGDEVEGVYNNLSEAYFMTDESVFNSLLAFSSLAPESGGFPFDKYVGRRVIHFGMVPKPWQGWTLRHLQHYRLVIDTIDWCLSNGYNIPELTPALKPENYRKEYLLALLRNLLWSARSRLSAVFYKIAG